MLFLWFDHPLIEAWLERQFAAPRRDRGRKRRQMLVRPVAPDSHDERLQDIGIHRLDCLDPVIEQPLG